uniref:Uncharacterized protein n=1 Tax=Cyclopterus lumpus TaxID=8103 RepID=A0A8C3G1J4_CYCLU
VVESAGPIDGDIRLLILLHPSRSETLTPLHLFAVLGHVVWSDGPQELDVVVAVVFSHLLTTGFVDVTHVNLHFPVQSIVEKEVVRHADPVGFHGVALAVVVVPHVALETENNHPDRLQLLARQSV